MKTLALAIAFSLLTLSAIQARACSSSGTRMGAWTGAGSSSTIIQSATGSTR